MLSEFFDGGPLEDVANEKFYRGHYHEWSQEDLMYNMNNLTGFERVHIALNMAKSIALLHNWEGGVIVHNDIQPQQFFMTESFEEKTYDDGEPLVKLHDFNRAEIMLWDDVNKRYCKYRNGGGGGNWRAPEEYEDDWLNEKMDIWSLGLNIMQLVDGLEPFPELDEEAACIGMILAGNNPVVRHELKERSEIDKDLLEIVERCLVRNTEERLSIAEVIELLEATVEKHGLKRRIELPVE